MSRKVFFHPAWLLSALVTLFTNGIFAQTQAVLVNPGFENFHTENDSFPGWNFTKDSTGGSQFIISQETDSAHTGNGALKIEITGDPLDSINCTITGSIQSLPENKDVTITAWVKYTNLPSYYSAQFSLMQATMLPPDYEWIDRDWTTCWGNAPGTSDWVPVTTDNIITVDSANIFNLVIGLGTAGTFWVDDIEITYTDIVPVTHDAIGAAPRQSITGNRIDFVRPTRYTLEAFDITGKAIVQKSGRATTLDLENLKAGCGAYLYRVTTAERAYTKRAVVVR